MTRLLLSSLTKPRLRSWLNAIPGRFVLPTVTALLWLGWAASIPTVRAAWADGSPPHEKPPSCLILGVHQDGSLAPLAREALARKILSAQLGVALVPGLSPEQLRCRTQPCLEQLASSYPAADYFIGGAILWDPENQRHRVQVWLHYAPPARAQRVADDPGLLEQICDHCPEERRLLLLTDTLVKLLQARGILAPAPAPAESPKPPGPCTDSSGWSFGRAFLLGASAGLTASGLFAGAALASSRAPTLEIATATGFPQTISGPSNLGDYSAVGFAAAGLGTIGTSLALLPSLWPRGMNPGPCAGRWTSARGGVVGLFSGLLLASTVSGVAFSAAKGPCVSSIPQVECSYPQQAGLSGGLSGAWLVGLTLSLAWPSSPLSQ